MAASFHLLPYMAVLSLHFFFFYLGVKMEERITEQKNELRGKCLARRSAPHVHQHSTTSEILATCLLGLLS